MRLVSYAAKDGAPRLGALTQHGVVDLYAAARELGVAREVFASMSSWLEAGERRLLDTGKLPTNAADVLLLSNARLLPPVPRPGKIVAIGLNYKDHAAETKQPIPKEPVIFLKATSALAGPNDPVIMPKGGAKLDWEVELAFVIGKQARYVEKQDALDHIAGYVLHNDYSERAFQMERGGQWVKGKSADTFAPLGPFVATREEIPEPGRLEIWLKVNGAMRQKSNTEQMIFGVAELLSYVSQFMTLLPGDVISTGTPPGVALGMNPPVYLKAGDTVSLGIECLGESQQEVVAYTG